MRKEHQHHTSGWVDGRLRFSHASFARVQKIICTKLNYNWQPWKYMLRKWKYSCIPLKAFTYQSNQEKLLCLKAENIKHRLYWTLVQNWVINHIQQIPELECTAYYTTSNLEVKSWEKVNIGHGMHIYWINTKGNISYHQFKN